MTPPRALRPADGGPSVVHCPVTPYDADGSIDAEALASLLRFHAQHQPTAIALMTFWGDGVGLSNPEERLLIVETARDAVGSVPFMVNVTTSATAHAVDLAQHAVANGAAAVMVGPPLYWRLREDELLGHLGAVASSVPDTAVYLLNDATDTSAGSLTPALVARLAGEHRNTVGLADARLEYLYLVRIASAAPPGGALQVLGFGDYLVPLAGLGAGGVLSGVAGVMPRTLAALQAAVRSGDEEGAKALQHRCSRVARLVADSPLALKAIHRHLGRDVGDARAPSRNLPGDVRERLLREFDELMRGSDEEGWG